MSINTVEQEVIMSASLNKVCLIGNLGKDPEVRTFQNGGRAANFSIATSESWKDKDTGERKERTEWHRISILSDGLVGIAEKYLKKGSRAYLEGQLETRKWTDRDGVERHSTEVVLRPYSGELILLDARKDDPAAHAEPGMSDEPPALPEEASAEVAKPAQGKTKKADKQQQ
jgi:single-strand DNA-binding protein